MTLDAMHWVWSHSQSKGNARLAMLYVADQVRTPQCVVRLSYADFMEALNAPRSTVKAAIKAAVLSGELELTELGKGTRSSQYRLAKAVGYKRDATASGPESDPLEPEATPSSGPDSDPVDRNHDHASGPDSDPQWAGFRPSSGPDSDPHSPSHSPSKQEGESEGRQQDGYGIPDVVRPLVDSMTASGVVVRWPFSGNQWFPVVALINKCGIQALVAYARRTSDRTHVDSARYFMRGWSELPPKPAAGSPIHVPRPHLRAVGQSPEDRGIF